MSQPGNSGDVCERTTVGAAAKPHFGTGVDDSEEWLSSLRAAGAEREAVIGRLHELLLRAARFEGACLISCVRGVA